MKKTIILVSLLIFLAAFTISITACKPNYSTGSVLGTWVNGSYQYTFNEDGTYSYAYDDGSTTTERENGTYSLDGVNLTLDIDQYWDYSEDVLVDDEEERKEVKIIGADEEKLALNNIYYGGNSETMVGTWEWSETASDIYEIDNYKIIIQLNEDGSYYISYEENSSENEDDIDRGSYKGSRVEPTWELSEDGTQVILTGSEGSEESFDIEIIGEGVYVDLFGGNYYIKQ